MPTIDLFPDLPDTFTAAEGAKHVPQSRRTLDRWVAEGILPAYRFGGRVLIRKADLLALVQPVRAAS